MTGGYYEYSQLHLVDYLHWHLNIANSNQIEINNKKYDNTIVR